MLLAGGARGRRQILRHGRVVLHAPAAEGRGTIPDLILEADEIERVRSLLEELLARDTGKTPQQVREDTERDLVLTAELAREYGVVDAVITERETAGVDARSGREADRRLRVDAGADAGLPSRPRESRSRRRSGPSAPAIAASSSEEGSFRPRSTSERYCGDTPASSATSTSRLPEASRSSRSC